MIDPLLAHVRPELLCRHVIVVGVSTNAEWIKAHLCLIASTQPELLATSVQSSQITTPVMSTALPTKDWSGTWFQGWTILHN